MWVNVLKYSADIVMKGYNNNATRKEQVEASVHSVIHTLLYGITGEADISPISVIIRVSCPTDFTTYRRVTLEKKIFDRGI